MSNGDNISIEELAANRAFRKWVLNPNDISSAFWDNWTKEEKGRTELIEKARLLVLALEEQFGEPADENTIQADLVKLMDRARQGKQYIGGHKSSGNVRRSGYIWRVAASLILLGSIGLWYSKFRNTAVPAIVKVYSGTKDTEWLTKENTSDKTQTVLLSDGSVVMLERESELIYPSSFSGSNRAVYLKGDAFFDVTKDASKPFLVFAGQTVTKVLGTSFRIRALHEDGDVLVAVKTGKVSVYNQIEFNREGTDSDSVSSVTLAPNEEVLFSTRIRKNEKEVISDAEILSSLPDDAEVVFEERPVAEIFLSLEKKYGIEIVYDKAKLSSCLLSTVFKEEGLKQRLNAVCTAIGATYIVEGEKVVVQVTDGCK